MIAVYDTAKDYNRVLYWDDDNRLTKTVDTTAGKGVSTVYNYDAKGMRVIKDGPYGKSIYVDTGFIASTNTPGAEATLVSNHVFVGNTRVASIVKHKDEQTPATYYYASDHLGSSSVLTTQMGSYHERIEYLPYGEVWVEDCASTGSATGSISGYSTPYKFTGKELDKETGLYYFGARYYDTRMSRWISTDPAIEKYLPKSNDYDTEHDFYWYILNDASGKLPGMGGVYNTGNLDVYCYSLNNPVKYFDPDGKQTVDPEVFKQLIMSDPLIQLVKGIFEGDAAAKYAVKMGTIEVGIKAGDAMNDIGTGLIIFGTMDGNPAMVIVGGAIDTVGDITRLSFMIVKATDTESAKDINDAMNEGISSLSSMLIGNVTKDIAKTNLKNEFHKFIRDLFSKEGKITEIDKKAGEKLVEKIAGDSGKIVLSKIYRKEK